MDVYSDFVKVFRLWCLIKFFENGGVTKMDAFVYCRLRGESHEFWIIRRVYEEDRYRILYGSRIREMNMVSNFHSLIVFGQFTMCRVAAADCSSKWSVFILRFTREFANSSALTVWFCGTDREVREMSSADSDKLVDQIWLSPSWFC